MKNFLLIFLMAFVFACENKDAENSTVLPPSTSRQSDTVIISKLRTLSASYDTGFLSRSHWYYWTVGNDTLDFQLLINEYSSDSLIGLSIHHKKPVSLSTALRRIENCFEVIKNDYQLNKLSSLYLERPLLYPDLVKSLSSKYEQDFGVKEISYDRLNNFLLQSELTAQLNNLLSPFNKKVKRYSIEKFHLINKKNYSFELPDTDFTDYPDFAIHGMGVSVYLENKH